ncbi:MAG: glycosyltransferase family 2 protein [Candidatus Comchoanobacterales bacterium]
MKLSVVIPLYQEEDNVLKLIDQVREALTHQIDYELILVDDGSTDATVPRAKSVLKDHEKIIELSRNYGQSAAMSAGIEHAAGDFIVTLDGDLQNDPNDIMMMLSIMKERNCDVVAGWRKNRKDGVFLRKIPSKIANYLIRRMTGVYLNDYGCTLKVFKSSVAKSLQLYGELHRFIPVLAHFNGAKIEEVVVNHRERIHGLSKYGIGRTFKVISDLMLMLFLKRYANQPMHLFGTLGVFLFLIGGGIETYLLALKCFGYSIGARPLFSAGILCIIAGIQFVSMGFVSELVMRTYYESQNKKTYRIKHESESRAASEEHEKTVA